MLDPAPALAAASPDPAEAPARAVINAQMAMLTRLAEIGMVIAEACGREAAAIIAARQPAGDDQAPRPTDAPAPALLLEPRAFLPGAPSRIAPRDPGLVFSRVARAVRMTIALQSRLMGDLAALNRAEDDAHEARKTTRRIRLSRLVDQAAAQAVQARRADADAAIRRDWAGGGESVEDEIERLSCDAYERLTDAEDEDLDGLSFEAVVASVCADLGLPPDWRVRLRAAMTPPPEADDAPEAGSSPGPGNAAAPPAEVLQGAVDAAPSPPSAGPPPDPRPLQTAQSSHPPPPAPKPQSSA